MRRVFSVENSIHAGRWRNDCIPGIAMDTVYSKRSFDDEPVTCPACRWTGKGADTKIIDLYGVGSMKDIRCPQCDKKLGDLADPGMGAGSTSADNFQLE